MDKMAKILLVFLCICLFACAIPAMAANETSGKCGENVTWSFDEQTQTLTISGTGEMNNDTFSSEMRWAHLYDKIRYIVIEDGITSICDFAFDGSTELKEVTIPESVTYIGQSAFGRSGLRHIDLHDGITYIGIFAFERSRLEEVTVPAGVKELSIGVFRSCGNLKSVVLPEGLTAIHWDAFMDCTVLESIVIPNSVTAIQCWAFRDCVALETVTFGTGIEEISPSAFRGCEGLKSYVVSEENKTFANDEHGVIYSKDGSRLELIPSGFTGEYTVAQGTRIICAEVGYGCTGLTGLVIPDSVTEIERYAFQDCVALKTLQLGNGLQIIRAGAFRGGESLEILIIPASVTYLENSAFGACSALRTIEFLGERPHFESYVFADVKADAWYPAGNTTWENNFPEDAYYVTWHPGCGGAHSFVDDVGTPPTCAEEGTTASTYCSICNLPKTLPVKIPVVEHCFGPWTYLTPAGTPLPDGIVRRNCEVCGTEQRENVRNIDQSLLPEAPTDETNPHPTRPDGTKPDAHPKKPAKLDAVTIVILVIVVVAACFVGVEVYLTRKKKKAKQS